MAKPTFIMKTDYLTYFRAMKLTKADVGSLMLAIFEYCESGAVPTEKELGGALFAAFMLIKIDLDRNAEKYSKKCRVLAGNRNQQKSDEISHDNDGDSVSDSDSDNDNAYAAACGGSGAAAAAERLGIKALYTELIGKWSSNVEKRLFSYGLGAADIRYAITEASENNVPKLSYIAKILERKKGAEQTPGPRGCARARPTLDPQAVEEMRIRLAAEAAQSR